ncbi:hypothetical protein CSKR_113700, partial [Clonorchis sinensis]
VVPLYSCNQGAAGKDPETLICVWSCVVRTKSNVALPSTQKIYEQNCAAGRWHMMSV